MDKKRATVTTEKAHGYKRGDVVDVFGLRVTVGRVLSKYKFEIAGLAPQPTRLSAIDQARLDSY